MTTRFEFDETVKAYMDEMLIQNRDLLNQALSKGGAIINRSIRRAMKSSAGTKYHTEMIKNIENKQKVMRRTIVSSSIERSFGDRFKHTGNLEHDNPRNMISMIKNYLNEDANLVVIAGRHPSFRPIKFEEGKRIGAFGKVISGTAKKGQGRDTGKDIFNILEKLEKGGTFPLSEKQQVLIKNIVHRVIVNGKLVDTKPNFRKDITTATYKARGFISKGYMTSAMVARGKIISEYEKYFVKMDERINKKVA